MTSAETRRRCSRHRRRRTRWTCRAGSCGTAGLTSSESPHIAGKDLRTTFLCEYLRLESLRRKIHQGLEVTETWNSANDFILYGMSGKFASNKTEDHELLMLSLHLPQISPVYVSTLMIQDVLVQSAWQGRLTATDLRALTPLKWAHINPFGTFLLDMQQRLRLELAA